MSDDRSSHVRRTVDRVRALRVVLVATAAVVLGLPAAQVQAQARARSLAAMAAERGVDVERLRAAALASADPLLDEAVRAGDLTPAQRAALRRYVASEIVVHEPGGDAAEAASS